MAQDEQSTDTASHSTGTRQGEEIKEDEGKESGRHDEGETGAERPAGSSTARDSTGINAEDENPIDPNAPHYPAP
jgi:hypothetical protein